MFLDAALHQSHGLSPAVKGNARQAVPLSQIEVEIYGLVEWKGDS